MRTLVLVLALALLFPLPGHSQESRQGRQAFEELKTLVGDWRDAGSDTTVNFRLIANDSALVETWTMGPGRQSMTVYTLDGDGLIATHYCPQGNAPRLKLSAASTPGTSRFAFHDGANLQDRQRSHMHAFWTRIDTPTAITRGETYVANRQDVDPSHMHETVTVFHRVE